MKSESGGQAARAGRQVKQQGAGYEFLWRRGLLRTARGGGDGTWALATPHGGNRGLAEVGVESNWNSGGKCSPTKAKSYQ